VKLYDAARCPYCARVRIALAEKGLAYEAIPIDLDERPDWIYELNPTGKVPVLDDGFVVPESAVIMEYLEDAYPETPLLPADPEGRARARLALLRFDDLLGADYYARRRGLPNELDRKLDELPAGESLFADIAYLPWLMRLGELFGVALPAAVEARVAALSERPAIAAELEIVRQMAR
jgi:glutathione S-transferase